MVHALTPLLTKRATLMVAKTFSATHFGLNGQVIEIEAAIDRGLPAIFITGMPSEVVRESRERIRTCLSNFGFDIPSARTVVHLSPAEDKKQGSQLDLAIAVSLLKAERLFSHRDIRSMAFLGELSLEGQIRPIHGALALVECLEKLPSVEKVVVPKENAREVRLLSPSKVCYASHFSDIINFLTGKSELPKDTEPSMTNAQEELVEHPSLDEVYGQTLAKRALQIALAGRHHLCLVGSPGVGKSMLASCAPALLPDLSRTELIEVTKNYSFATYHQTPIERRPYRNPHHTISTSGLLGGGTGRVIPGEVTLSHAGVLFLDEFPEFRRDAIEGLREPLQSGVIHLHRVGHSLSLLSRFTLITAMNPCPCGYLLSKPSRCYCSPDRVQKYQRRISGPILDRIDLYVAMEHRPGILNQPVHLREANVRATIAEAIRRQKLRFTANSNEDLRNGDLSDGLKSPYFPLTSEAKDWFNQLLENSTLNLRGLNKILKVARTVADLACLEKIDRPHLIEAKALRCPDSFAQHSGQWT